MARAWAMLASTMLLIKILARVVLFGIALAFVSRQKWGVRIRPKSALPLVALVFAVLNTFLYWMLAVVLNIVTLTMMWFLVPFVANAILLWATDKLLKPIKVDGVLPLFAAAGVLTVAHIVLRLAHM